MTGPPSLRFIVRGTPAPQGSKTSYGRGRMVESSKKVGPWRSDVKAAAEQAIRDHGAWEPLAGPTHVTVTFHLRRPRTHYRTGRYAAYLRDNAPLYVITTPDLDKAVRATFDALTAAGVITDDRVISSLSATKEYTDSTPGATIYVTPLS